MGINEINFEDYVLIDSSTIQHIFNNSNVLEKYESSNIIHAVFVEKGGFDGISSDMTVKKDFDAEYFTIEKSGDGYKLIPNITKYLKNTETIECTYENLLALHVGYINSEEDTFLFKDGEINKNYAKYLIEYMSGQLLKTHKDDNYKVDNIKLALKEVCEIDPESDSSFLGNIEVD